MKNALFLLILNWKCIIFKYFFLSLALILSDNMYKMFIGFTILFFPPGVCSLDGCISHTHFDWIFDLIYLFHHQGPFHFNQYARKPCLGVFHCWLRKRTLCKMQTLSEISLKGRDSEKEFFNDSTAWSSGSMPRQGISRNNEERSRLWWLMIIECWFWEHLHISTYMLSKSLFTKLWDIFADVCHALYNSNCIYIWRFRMCGN